jgi:hypothetical protein
MMPPLLDETMGKPMGHGSNIPSNLIFHKKRENMIFKIIFSRLQRATIL